jgi:cephalosporin-C deacetylase-like acetyl esterase
MRTLLVTALLLFMYFTTETLHAQSNPSQKNARIELVPDEENLNVFQQWLKWSNSGSLMIHHLTSQAVDHYEKRDRDIAKLKTKSEWKSRQDLVKEKLMQMVGPFPKKGALNARVTGTIKKEGYRIDKIVFEAMPGYFVTGCIYVPEGKGSFPAILNVIGHNQEAFRNPLYQVINQNLAKKGMIVFAIDPPGQGEHVQYFDPKINYSSIGYSVIEHCYFGYQCFLTGSSAARYFLWEGIRAIDYLVSRKDVDPERIGVTGFSGGGTVTTYISAFDERVKVSIPCSWSTMNRRLLETKGIQDPDAFFVHSLGKGITVEDLLEVRAPKPALLTFTSRDEYLAMQGALEAYSEAKNAYQAMGAEENLAMVNDDSKHWLTPKIRLAIYTFFMKHFDLSGDAGEEEGEILSQEELQVTSTGQISTSFGGDMIFDVNKKESVRLMGDLEKSRKDMDSHLARVKIKAKQLSGFIQPASADAQPFLNGRYQREGYSVAKYAIMGEGNYPIPILLFVPDDNGKKHPALVYLDPKGKVNEAQRGGEIENLVKKGYIVASTDVLGIGETENTVANRQGTADAGNTAVLIGRSVVGIRAADIIRVVHYLKGRADVDTAEVGAIGIGEMCIPLIHAAAFDQSISNVTLIRSPISYRSIAMNRIFKIGLIPTGNKGPGLPYELDFSSAIAGVLTAYDLPDLIGSIAPREVTIIDLKDHALESASEELVKEEMAFPRAVYSKTGASASLRIMSVGNAYGHLVDWNVK